MNVLHAEPGELKITGYPVSMTVEGPPDHPDGRRVDHRPASGGQSFSTVDAEGSFYAELSGLLERGLRGEPHVMKTLVQALRDRGHDVSLAGGARDERGEDGLLAIDSHRTEVQIVTIPADPSVWRDLEIHNSTSFTGTRATAVDLVRRAIEHKSTRAKGALLAIDAAQVGAIVNNGLRESYRVTYGDPVAEFSFAAVWLIGPTVRSTIQLA